jgi:hypothetical protein
MHMDVTTVILPVYCWGMPRECYNPLKGGLQTHRLLYRWENAINAKQEVAADILINFRSSSHHTSNYNKQVEHVLVFHAHFKHCQQSSCILQSNSEYMRTYLFVPKQKWQHDAWWPNISQETKCSVQLGTVEATHGTFFIHLILALNHLLSPYATTNAKYAALVCNMVWSSAS